MEENAGGEYNFRDSTKRRRLEKEELGKGNEYFWTCGNKRKSPIHCMPTEVLQSIFSFISYGDLALNVRLVSRRFRTIAQDRLNAGFRSLEGRLMHVQELLCNSYQHSRSDVEIQCMCKILNIMEILTLHHSVIKSTIWRYVYNKYKSTSFCMYGGVIIDLYNGILSMFFESPEKLYNPALSKEYSLPEEVQRLCTLCKTFSLYFDRVSEMPLNTSVFFSGAKILDILDCATEAKRNVLHESIGENSIYMKVKYHFSHTWFVALDMTADKKKRWNDEQRLMYMRLRRIVLSHTEMHLEYVQYRREDVLRPSRYAALKKPVNSVYTGYGEVGSNFFYYGVMNAGAYRVKFETQRNIYRIFEAEGEEESEEPPLSEVKSRKTFLGTDIFVVIRCPIALAPRRVVESVERKSNFTSDLKRRKRLRGVFDMDVTISCPPADYPRLPVYYHVNLKEKK